MDSSSPLRRAAWPAMLAAAGLTGALFVSCQAITGRHATPTPTRTPRPPTATPTLIPSPTPTPAWPLSASCDADVPYSACDRFREAVDRDPDHFAWTDDSALAEVHLGTQGLSDSRPFGTWVYALVAPFFAVNDQVTAADLSAPWGGEPAGLLTEHPLLVSPDTRAALGLTTLGGGVHVLEASELLTEAIQSNSWAIVPFDELEPRWKVLEVDGVSPIDRALDLQAYPLARPLYLRAHHRPDVLSRLPSGFTNRDPGKMTVLMMTGVTALTRGTGVTMEREGVTYPARDVWAWLTEPDITHVSNEVSFAQDCPAPTGQSTMVFCSDPRYFGLFEHVDVDVVELTGNHLLDWGLEAMQDSLRMYEEHGLRYFGGGWDLEHARQPVTITHGVHTFGFAGCNPIGPASVWATVERPGAAPCDYGLLLAQIGAMRERGVIPIVTLQHWEVDQYAPTSSQRVDFRALAEAGAAVVSGSQAHWPQGFEFHAGSFIHYGLGNLFFDQMQRVEYRQEFLDRHVFYDGRHISTEVLTAILEDYARPRPMTEEERKSLLEAAFAVSEW